MDICCNDRETGLINLFVKFGNDFINRIKERVLLFQKASFSKISDKSVRVEQRVREERNRIAEYILDEYGNTILRYAYTYLHNIEDAEEILQDTIMKYLDKRPNFNDKEHEKAWLLTVTANLSKNRINYNQIRETDELADNLAENEREDLSFVWEAVKELPDKYREVMHLFYYEGYKTTQISKLLHRNESSVRSDLRRGRQKLKEILEEAYGF